MKPKLIILSDLWGKEKSGWVKNYINLLDANFEIKFYDSCELGKIRKDDYTEESLHLQFINGGIDMAVKQLLILEKQRVNVLAFSIGGSIAWKANLKGLKIDNFYAVSSTRVRYETKKPNCYTKLYFGENDTYKPNLNWHNTIEIAPIIFKDKDHKLYSDIECIKTICTDVKNASSNY